VPEGSAVFSKSRIDAYLSRGTPRHYVFSPPTPAGSTIRRVVGAPEEDDLTDPTDEIDAEHAHIDWSYECLDFMRNRAADLLANAPSDPDLQAALTRRVNQLTDTGRALCFGRLDTEDGNRWHIGRRHVEDKDNEPVVIEWRAPVAVPFYR